jgi:hypothetical protein
MHQPLARLRRVDDGVDLQRLRHADRAAIGDLLVEQLLVQRVALRPFGQRLDRKSVV